jgi:hypothetical protein
VVSITSPIMHNFRILFLRSYHPPDSFLSIRLFRLRRLADECGRQPPFFTSPRRGEVAAKRRVRGG